MNAVCTALGAVVALLTVALVAATILSLPPL